MRQIKFRGFFDGAMYYPDTTHEYSNVLFHCFSEIAKGEKERKECALMQFTGRKDMDGKDLYESDIVLFNGQKMEVRWDTNRAGFVLAEYNHPIYDDNYLIENSMFVEVIGNIYENPYLLK